jgi:hypothetical protein
MELSSLVKFMLAFMGRFLWQAAIDRVMHTYGMIVDLTLEEEQAARQKASRFLADAKTDDEHKLAVEGSSVFENSK